MNEEQMANDLCKEKDWAKGREQDVVSWLENFQPEHREPALQLLRKIQVYSINHCQKWCQKLHGYLPSEIRKSTNTFYGSIGSPSESGSLVSYYYRTVNGLAADKFLDFSQITDAINLKRRSARSLVFLDDFIGSGNQAIEFWQLLSSHLGRHADDLDFYYSAFAGYCNGRANIEKNTRFKVQVVRELGESDKAFGVDSKVFEPFVREIAKKIL